MGFKIKNITYLLDRSNYNYNKPVIFKIKRNLRNIEFKILPYQEIIFDSNLLPTEIKKMEMLGMVQCLPLSSGDIDSINNPKKKVDNIQDLNKEDTKKRKITKNKKED